MQTKNQIEIDNLLKKSEEKANKELEECKLYGELINDKATHQVRVKKAIFVMISTYCENKIINAPQYINEILAKAILKDTENCD